MDKFEEWFSTLSKKVDKIGEDILLMREELSDIRGFIEQHQTDMRLCKLAIERMDDKVENLRRHP